MSGYVFGFRVFFIFYFLFFFFFLVPGTGMANTCSFERVPHQQFGMVEVLNRG